MAISIYKVISDMPYADGRIVNLILSDGASKRLVVKSGLPNNNDQARADVLAVGQDLFDKGSLWDDTPGNISTPAKDFLDSLPNWSVAETAINNISTLAGAKPVLKNMAKAILALKEMVT